MKHAIRPAISGMEASKIREVANAGMEMEDVIPLWFGESDRPTPDVIKQAAVDALARDETRYAANVGIPELRTAIRDYSNDLYGCDLSTNQIAVTGSGMQAVMLTIQMLIEPGSNMVTIGPTWPNIPGTVRIMGGDARIVSLEETDGVWSLDLGKLLDAVDENTKVIFVNSPGNPTGWVMPREQQEELLRFARERGIWLLSDDVYSRVVYEGSHAPSFLEIAQPGERLISLNSFSKAWRMTGWRLGWVVAPEELLDQYAKLTEFNTSCQPPFVQHAGIAALRKGEDSLQNMMAELTVNRQLVTELLGPCEKLRISAPDAAFYAFFAVEGMDDSVATAKEILRATHVGLAPGAAFGPEGEGYLRICFANGTERLREALSRLADYFNA